MREIIELLEAKKTLELKRLPYSHGSLAPVLTQDNIDFHYGKLYKGYVDRYNKGEGDSTFNEAGAYLHNIFFPQLRAPKNNNQPHGASLALINRKYGGLKELKAAMKTEAMKIQGSGWIYLSRSGDIKTIKNHEIKKDIVVLVDWWEHAWALDYQQDKAKYLENIWQIVDWDVISARLATKQ